MAIFFIENAIDEGPIPQFSNKLQAKLTWIKNVKLNENFKCKIDLTLTFGYNFIKNLRNIAFPGWNDCPMF